MSGASDDASVAVSRGTSGRDRPVPTRWDDLEEQALGFRPLGSRLRPPRSQVPLVPRDVLVGSLLADSRPLLLVCAPAGYGKSIALAEWIEADPRPSAWLQLDAADNDPVVLLGYLALVLAQVTSLDPAILRLLRLRTPPIEERIVPAMAEALGAAAPFLLVLDDGHLLQSDAGWRLIGTLIDHVPEDAQITVGTRADPPLPLARLRAAGRLGEYRTADLALDRRETRELLRLHGRGLAPAALDELLAATEGWVAGMHLALLANADRPASDWLPSVRGDHRAIASYLTEEVVERQPPDVQSFLLRTSILDRLSPDLCRAVTGDDRAGALLAKLAGQSLFVTGMDDRDEWYRYHHLFAELVAALEARREPGELPALHRRAAAWHLDHGDAERAVRHWLAAGDVAAAAWPTYCAVSELCDRGQNESARRLLDSFTDQQLSEHFELTFAAGWFYGTIVGDPGKGERWRRAACSMPTGDEPWPDGESSWRAAQAGLRAFLAPDGVTRMLADAEVGLSCEREGSEGFTEAQRVLGVAAYLCGRPRRADGVFKDVAEIHEYEPAISYALAFRSLIAADEERWDDAAELDRQALAMTPDMTLGLSPGMYLALPMLLAHARVLARGNDPEATAAVARAERYLGDMVPQVPWRVTLIAVVLGEVQLHRGESADAERWTRRAEAALASGPDPGAMLSGRTHRLRESLEQLRMSDPLTATERRVLDLLPTQLTAPQIAARLFVTLNTVKSHQKHLYTKLGVTTRTDAVGRARELGLLSPRDD